MAVKKDIKSTFKPTSAPKAENSVVLENPELEVKAKREVKRSKTVEKKEEASSEDDKTVVLAKKKKSCVFCNNNDEPKYWDANALRRHMSDRGRINGRGRTNLCAKHQRRLSRQIKYARHLAILPFKVSV